MRKSRQAGALSARGHALAVLRIRSAALSVALLPAAVAIVLHAASLTGRIGSGWDGVRWAVTGVAVVALAVASGVAAVIARAQPALTPTIPVEEASAPDLYALVRDLARRLEVPVPSSIALTPDCDSWLEDRTHPAHQRAGGARRGGAGQAAAEAPVLVIGSPFLWWMRVAELRSLLAPVVAGTGPSAHPDIAAARRCVRGLDAAVALADRTRAAAGGSPAGGGPAGRSPAEGGSAGGGTAEGGWVLGPLRRAGLRFVGWVARSMLRSCGPHTAEMERGVAAAAADRAKTVDRGLRTTAQEQVGLAYAGWDRLLTRVALPAWRTGRWPGRLNAGVVSALTELSRRDRLAEGFASRLGERPACDLLEEPGAVDTAISLLAARLFHGEPTRPDADWAPVDWADYPEEVVDRIWRMETSRLFEALDATEAPAGAAGAAGAGRAGGQARECGLPYDATLARVIERLAGDGGEAIGARISAAVAREELARAADGPAADPGGGPHAGAVGPPSPMGLPLRPPRTGRELLAEHVTAAVCCAAVDTMGAAPGLDWLDGPALLLGGERAADLTRPVLALVEDGDPGPLRGWLATVGVRADKPVRLV
ncbi:hypothetical protein LHJ74_05905 [Streptomyces sp. N2-109]|uniref:Integral membrane protein n=1 Tax=Streptomyces gossypii TaxID=2883101 RepID=A0ABT2JNK5_9ACTN|nr:hypothetical protein [Streptomyces gossypii]MCT2589468.1 hypothetical protein [Streptomyces gossypii]